MIEASWAVLAAGQVASQTRIDASHPHDLYADFEPPDRVGLVALCASRPPMTRPMRALAIEEGIRGDGRWALRLMLVDHALRPVFAAFCDDIVACTRLHVAAPALAATVVKRLVHWRTLLEQDGSGLGESTLRGLIGELTVLGERVCLEHALLSAVRAWTAPWGTAQDFQLPSGTRLEVKTVGRLADQVRINGLAQLDAGSDPLVLVVVRLEKTGAGAPDAVTASSLVAALRARFECEPETLLAFETALSAAGWHEHPAHEAFTVRVTAVESYDVDQGFPRLMAATVPVGVVDVDYLLSLPTSGRSLVGGMP